VDDRADLRDRLGALLIRLAHRLGSDQVTIVREYVDVGELVLALEQMADILSEDEIGLRDDERAQMLALSTHLGMGDRVPHALTFCPTAR
jgi:hypothetical protein